MRISWLTQEVNTWRSSAIRRWSSATDSASACSPSAVARRAARCMACVATCWPEATRCRRAARCMAAASVASEESARKVTNAAVGRERSGATAPRCQESDSSMPSSAVPQAPASAVRPRS